MEVASTTSPPSSSTQITIQRLRPALRARGIAKDVCNPTSLPCPTPTVRSSVKKRVRMGR